MLGMWWNWGGPRWGGMMRLERPGWLMARPVKLMSRAEGVGLGADGVEMGVGMLTGVRWVELGVELGLGSHCLLTGAAIGCRP